MVDILIVDSNDNRVWTTVGVPDGLDIESEMILIINDILDKRERLDIQRIEEINVTEEEPI